MKKGKRVNLDYVLTDVLIIGLIGLSAFLLLTFLMDLIGSYKFGFSWWDYRMQAQIFKKKFFRYILLELTFLGLFIWIVVKFLTRKSAEVNRKLAKFIKYNNYITYEIVNKKKKLKDKADLRYILNQDYLTINIYLHGSTFDDKLKESREKIEDIFMTSISSMSVDFGKVTYEIGFKPLERIEAIHYIPNAIELDKTKIWDYNTIPHGLIAGSTGSGKTYFLNYIICNLLANDADITFIDPKSADIKAVGELVNPQKTACTENQIAKLVREFSEEMEARQKNYRKKWQGKCYIFGFWNETTIFNL